MKFVKTGEYRPNALESEVEIVPFDEALRSPLKRLDYLLGFVKRERPEILSDIADNLSAKYENLQDFDYFMKRIIDFPKMLTDLVNLSEFPTLSMNAMNFYLHVLDMAKDVDWIKSPIKVATRKQLRFYLLPRYYNLEGLIETLDREEGIALYKRYITQFLIDSRDPDRDRYDSLEVLFKKRTKPKDEQSDWVMVHGMIGDGKYAYRNDNCLWVDALDDLQDSEMVYYVCCYGDYEGARIYHESVVLTMEHTIAQGDPYCSRVLHDTRVDWNLTHPSGDFWDNISIK